MFSARTRLIVLSAALVVASVLVIGASASTSWPSCLGEPATIVGTDGNDTINGTSGNDTIAGLGGGDYLGGGTGDDKIDGGTGRDWVDYYDAPAGVHVSLAKGTASGGAGADTFRSIELVYGSKHSDVLVGSPGTDRL